MSQKFHISQILSITTGRLLCSRSDHPEYPRGMDGIYDILNYMSGDDLQTLSLPRVGEEARPYLLRQFPWVLDAEKMLPDFSKSPKGSPDQTVDAYIELVGTQFGFWHNVIPMNENDHEHLTPLEDILRINPNFDPNNLINFDPTENQEPPVSDIGDINWKVD